jgi:two-component system, LuxR family, response regulator FixJ
VRPFILTELRTVVKHLPKVFVVDEDPAIMSSLGEFLLTHEYDVRYFKSVDAFKAQHHPTQVGCVLVDMLMPGMGGSELLKFLQDSGSLLSVVIISGLIDPVPFDQEKGEFATLLEKPYEMSALLTMIADGVACSFRRRAERHQKGWPK